MWDYCPQYYTTLLHKPLEPLKEYVAVLIGLYTVWVITWLSATIQVISLTDIRKMVQFHVLDLILAHINRNCNTFFRKASDQLQVSHVFVFSLYSIGICA